MTADEALAEIRGCSAATPMTKCVHCGHQGLKSTTEETEIRIGERVVRGVVQATKCPSCGEVFLPGEALERLDLEVAAELVRTGNVGGASFRFVRHALGMQSKELAELLGVTPETVSRWEKGQRDVDRLAWLALASLLQDSLAGRDETRRALEAVQHPTRMPATVKIASCGVPIIEVRAIQAATLRLAPAADRTLRPSPTEA